MAITRVYLLGFMGSGKTTTGEVLARRLGWDFIDLDEEVERVEGQSIANIFRVYGEAHFRRLEKENLERVSLMPRRVVALGGGTFIDPENRKITEETGLTVWLKVSFDKVVHRVKMDGTRPLFGSKEETEHLYRARQSSYELARVKVLADELTPEAIAAVIMGAMRTL
jgi:shikimate kinase